MFGALHLLAAGCAIIIPVQQSEQRAGGPLAPVKLLVPAEAIYREVGL